MVNLMNDRYGSAEYYSELFSDIIADVDAEYSPNATENMFQGFLLAIDSWLDYHSSQADEYTKYKERVLKALGMP